MVTPTLVQVCFGEHRETGNGGYGQCIIHFFSLPRLGVIHLVIQFFGDKGNILHQDLHTEFPLRQHPHCVQSEPH